MKSVFEDYKYQESVDSGDYHAGTEQLLYTVSRYEESEGQTVRRLMLRNLRSGEAECLLSGASGGSFAPDGGSICFLQKGVLCVMDLHTREVQELVRFPGAIMEPRWSPDGSSIAFLAVAAGDMAPEDAPGVIEDFGYKSDGAGFIRSEHMHLWAVSVTDGTVRQLTDGASDEMQHNWSPDGKQLVCVSTRGADRKESLHLNLWRVAADGSEAEQLTAEEWVMSYPTPVRPLFLSDGSGILFETLDITEDDPDMERGMPPARLMYFDLKSGDCSILYRPDERDGCSDCVAFPYFHGAPRGLERLALSSDGTQVYFMGGWNGTCSLYRMDLASHMLTVLTGEREICIGAGHAQNGKLLLSVGSSRQPGTLALLDEKSGKIEPITLDLNSWLAERDLSVPYDFSVPTLDRESRIHGWVLPPQNREPGRKYPAILRIHGGPHPFYTHGFEYENQCLAGAGFAVLYCNPRGSSGYTRIHRNMERAFDGAAYTDCLQFVDEACRRFDFIDPDRIGAVGGSYGGYMVNFMATHSRRFKAFVTQRSMVNNLISYASSDLQGDSHAYSSFECFMKEQLKTSPVCYVQNISAPVLILHGEDDLRCPVEGAHQLFTAIKDTHPELPCKLIIYPGCCHDVPSDMGQLLHYYHAMLDWFERYL